MKKKEIINKKLKRIKFSGGISALTIKNVTQQTMLERTKQPSERVQKEIPMLFSTDMVMALKNDLKTETRRDRNLKEINKNPDYWEFMYKKEGFYIFNDKTTHEPYSCGMSIKCPYGRVGDLIWVRETFVEDKGLGLPGQHFGYYYKAFGKEDIAEERLVEYITNKGQKIKWRSNMHMPKVAARIWLEITDITIERLQDITNKGAIAEGIEPTGVTTMGWTYKGRMYKDYLNPEEKHWGLKPVDSYKSIWEKINGKGSWDKNPWIWRVQFRKVNKMADFDTMSDFDDKPGDKPYTGHHVDSPFYDKLK